MPSCEASESDFEALTTVMTTALRATSNEWTLLASDGGSEEKRSLTQPVGIRMRSTMWTGGELLRVADQRARSNGRQRAVQSNQRCIATRNSSYSWTTGQYAGSSGRPSGQEDPRQRHPKAYSGFWKLACDATRKGRLKASWCPLHRKRPQWTCETSTEAARGLNDHHVSGARGTRTRRQCLARERRRHETYKHERLRQSDCTLVRNNRN